jgi:hypothetical protein
VIVVPPYDSPGSWRGGMSGISARLISLLSSSLAYGVVTLLTRLALSLSVLSANSAAVRPRASALP